MARKSRINQPLDNNLKDRFNVGVYVRLSVFNSEEDNDTIENQKKVVLNYIEKNTDLTLVKIYEDTNKTGTNFNREGFENLLKDVKKGIINCIIVKDLSRFGRDYKECSNYIENIFPFMNIRFIAINDNYDSFKISSNNILSMQLKNIVNETYAKDISKKVSSILRKKKENGQYMCTISPYGYLKDNDNKGNVIIDQQVKDVVIEIFNLRLKNYSYKSIADILNEKDVPSPYKRLVNLGLLKENNKKTGLWKSGGIRDILSNEFYIGTTIQGKFSRSKINTQLNNDKKIIKMENHHQPIIDKETFYKVQEINLKASEKYNLNKDKFKELHTKDDRLKGILKCGCCGKNLIRIEKFKQNKTKDCNIRISFTCNTRNISKERCSFTSIREDELLDVILKTIKTQIMIAKDFNEIISNNSNSLFNNMDKLQTQLDNKKIELNKLESKYEDIYTEYLENFLSEQDYIFIKNKYKEQEKNIKDEIKNLKKDIKCEKNKTLENPFLKSFLNFENNDKITKEMILALIKEIKVYPNKRIEIHFKFKKEFDILNNYIYSLEELK